MVYVAKRCQKYLFLRFLPGQPSVPVHLPAVFRPLRRALQCCRGGSCHSGLGSLLLQCCFAAGGVPFLSCFPHVRLSPVPVPSRSPPVRSPVGRSAPGPVACPCDSGPGGAACAVACPSFAVAFLCRCVPRPGEAEGKCGAGGGKSKKNRKSRKKVLKKFGNPAKSATFAVPFGKGALGAPPRIGGSSLNRKKEARAGPAEPAPSGRGQKSRPVQGKKTKVVLYNEEFDPGSG